MLRSGVTRSSGLQAGMLLRGAACPHSTGLTASLSILMKLPAPSQPSPRCIKAPASQAPRYLSTLARPLPSKAILFRPRVVPAARRHNSSKPISDAELDATAAAAAAASAALPPGAGAPLDWNTFFKLRKTRRWWQLGFSVATALVFGYGGTMFLLTGIAEPMVTQIPLDPIVTMGLMTFACAGLGWLVGPSLGSFGFYMLNSKFKAQMAVKESQFFARIKKNRVDPTASSMGNPVPDYYGEKIQSVAGYRQWLKDQRAFNKKRTTFL
ncbi:Pam17-domain-containing protein [Thozetella sp. PMI_491]|nr:Pam17-domain-containing protein [Thozetella sp. PMI_491]